MATRPVINVHNTGVRNLLAGLKWEGYITRDGEPQVHYFDNPLDMSMFLKDVWHTGDITIVTPEEFDAAYQVYARENF